MTREAKRTAVIVLFVIAGALAIFGMVNWQSANSTASEHANVAAFEDAVGVSHGSTEADHTPSYVAFGVGALALLAGVVLLASLPPAAPGEPKDESVPSGWG